MQIQQLIEQLEHLPPERQAEVGDFIAFLHQREQARNTELRAALLAGEQSGVSERTPGDIRHAVQAKLKADGRL